ncbi:hypothetical protein SAMN04489712_102243 [Thermomonospora echinospora]|uniref:Uncharacterized protein n=1 Tax=Thermomonospora echinospora TaxID=1992 RepID=A0A1H5VBE0_9ACTN|nr:hypothetical protein [Thermomonospora echinospora]SEF84426.1 hypothetical protein SAMN04489712_102243 [Thermomonospora echinospora]
MTLLDQAPAREWAPAWEWAGERPALGRMPLEPQAAARVRALRRARRNAQVRAIRVRRILLTR